MYDARMTVKPAMHRPLVGLAAAVAAGCVCGPFAPGRAAWFLIGAIAAVAAGFAVRRLTGDTASGAAGVHAMRLARAARAGTTLGCAFFLAAAHAAWFAAREEARSALLEDARTSRDLVTVTGTIVTEPSGFALPQGGGRLSFQLRVASIERKGGGDVPAPPFDLAVDFYGPVSLLGMAPSRPIPLAGEGWSFTGRIQSRELLYRSAPLLSLRSSIRDPHQRAPEADAPAWRQTLWNLRRATATRLSYGLADHPDAVAVLRATLLGYRSEIPEEVRTFFANSGTVHLFAISGLHIMIVANILFWCLKHLGVTLRSAAFVLIPALVAYTALTGGRPSAQRACLMAGLVYAAPLFQRRADPITAVAAAAIVLLAANPLQVSDLGFAFSFTSVLGILVLAPPLKDALEGALARRGGVVEEDALEERMLRAQQTFGARGWWRSQVLAARQWVFRNLVGSAAVSLAAWAVAEPITARVFGQMVPVSALSNLFVVFLGKLTVCCATAGLAVGCVSPGLGVVCNRVASLLVEFLIWLTSVFARIPGGNFRVEPWSPALVAAWYAALGGIAYLLRRRTPSCARGPEAP